MCLGLKIGAEAEDYRGNIFRVLHLDFWKGPPLGFWRHLWLENGQGPGRPPDPWPSGSRWGPGGKSPPDSVAPSILMHSTGDDVHAALSERRLGWLPSLLCGKVSAVR